MLLQQLTETEQLVGVLGIPGAIIAIAGAAWIIAKAVVIYKEGSLPHTNGSAESRGWMKAVLDHHSDVLREHTEALRHVSDVLIQLGRDFRQHSDQEMKVWHEVTNQLQSLHEFISHTHTRV